MTDTTRIYIKLHRHTHRGPVYQARFGSPEGSLLGNPSLEPLFSASRVLISRGVRGRIEMWDDERPYPRMGGDIATLAKLTIREDRDTPLTLCRWKPFPTATGRQKPGFGTFRLLQAPQSTGGHKTL